MVLVGCEDEGRIIQVEKKTESTLPAKVEECEDDKCIFLEISYHCHKYLEGIDGIPNYGGEYDEQPESCYEYAAQVVDWWYQYKHEGDRTICAAWRDHIFSECDYQY